MGTITVSVDEVTGRIHSPVNPKSAAMEMGEGLRILDEALHNIVQAMVDNPEAVEAFDRGCTGAPTLKHALRAVATVGRLQRDVDDLAEWVRQQDVQDATEAAEQDA